MKGPWGHIYTCFVSVFIFHFSIVLTSLYRSLAVAGLEHFTFWGQEGGKRLVKGSKQKKTEWNGNTIERVKNTLFQKNFIT